MLQCYFQPCSSSHQQTDVYRENILLSVVLCVSVSHLDIKGKIPETRMFGKALVMISHQVIEIIANSNRTLYIGATKSAARVGKRVGNIGWT